MTDAPARPRTLKPAPHFPDVDERELAMALALMSASDRSRLEGALEDEARRQDQAEAEREARPATPVLASFFGKRPDVGKGRTP